MGLFVSILVLLMLGLVFFQIWQLWFTRRELARLEQRLAESLDDQDLMEFQDRLKGLLAETRDAGLSLVQTIERRQAALEKVIVRAEDAEKRLSVRTQLLELAAKELVKAPPAASAKDASPKAKARTGKRPPATAAPVLIPSAPVPVEETSPAEAAGAVAGRAAKAIESAAQEEARRNYLSRPGAPTANAPSRHQRVYELSDQGLSREQIAREAGILPGEVELILNLRPGKRGAK
jgi:hypothetical protein